MKIYALLGNNDTLYGLSTSKDELEHKAKRIIENRGTATNINEYDISKDIYIVIDNQDGAYMDIFETKEEAEAYTENVYYHSNLSIIKSSI